MGRARRVPVRVHDLGGVLYAGLRTSGGAARRLRCLRGDADRLRGARHGRSFRGADLAVGTILALGAWIGGFVHALAIRRSVEEQLDLVDSTAVEAASRALARRQYGRELVRTQPALAKQLGVGRPDLPNSDSYGLIDVNHADAASLATLPGMTDDLARQVADFCREGGSFVSVEDLGLFLDLPAPAVDAMRELAVFPKEE